MIPLRTFVEIVIEAASRSFERNGCLRPFWHAVTAAGEHMILPPPDGFDKDMATVLVRAVFEARDVVRYAFVDEAWIIQKTTATEDADEVERLRRQMETIQDHPDAREILLVSAEDQQEGFVLARRHIERGADGKVKLAPLQFIDLEIKSAEGRMVGMLPRKQAAN